LTAASTTSGATFNWGGGVTTALNTVSAAGSYTVTVTDPSNSCSATATAIVVTGNTTLPNATSSVTSTNSVINCTTSTVGLTAASTTSGATFNWGGGVTTALNTVSAAGSYTVTVTDPSNSCSATATAIVVTGNTTLPVSPTISSPVTYCQNATPVSLTAGGTNLLWYTASTGGTGSATAPTPSTTSAATTSYYVSQTNASGCESGRSQINVIVNAAPMAGITGTITICTGTTTTLTGTGGSQYNWGTGMSATATFTTPSLTSDATYTVTVQNMDGCTATASQLVTVSPNANAGTVTGASNLCISATSTYTTNGDAGGTWTSSNTGVATVDAASGLVTAMSNGSTTITYTVTGCGSNLVATKSLVVGPPTLMVTSPLTACAPATVDLTAASVTAGSDAGLTFTYHNNPLGTGVFTGGNPAALSSTGTNIYYIRGTATSGCYDVKPVTVTINASITVNAGSDQNICAGTSANLAATSAATGTYTWSVKGNATVIATAASVTVTPSATTSYTVTITSGSCSATDEVVVAVKAPTISNSTVISVGPDCVDAQGYTLYTSGANVYFGIKWGALNTGAGKPSEKAKVTITVNGGGAPWFSNNGTQAWYVMGRHWDVDLDGSTINASEPVSVRFLFSPAEIAAMMAAAGATTFPGGGAVTVGTPSWFKTNNGTTFIPGTHLTTNGLSNSFVINNVNTTPNMWGGLNYAQFDGLTGFSGGTLAVPVNAASILPVTLTRFDAKKVGEQVNVTWKTASEYNSKSFVVEKSTDGVTFKTMATVAASGTTKIEHNYGTIDAKPASGDNYYRLLAIDMDGTSRYVGNVIKVNFQGNHSVSVYPNPTANDLTLNINIEEDMQAKVNVLDMDGKVIRSFAFDLLEGKNIQTLDVNDLPAGTYMLQTINGSNEVLDLRRFVKIVR
jgi:hypothetical protein